MRARKRKIKSIIFFDPINDIFERHYLDNEGVLLEGMKRSQKKKTELRTPILTMLPTFSSEVGQKSPKDIQNESLPFTSQTLPTNDQTDTSNPIQDLYADTEIDNISQQSSMDMSMFSDNVTILDDFEGGQSLFEINI